MHVLVLHITLGIGSKLEEGGQVIFDQIFGGVVNIDRGVVILSLLLLLLLTLNLLILSKTCSASIITTNKLRNNIYNK